MTYDFSSHQRPPLIVAELSGNHGGSFQKALELVEAAKECGADAVKLQTYKPETITVRSHQEKFLVKEGIWKGSFLHDLYEKAMTPWDWHQAVFAKAKALGMLCFSSPFDESAVDFLEQEVSPAIYKIASFELNHFPLLRKVAQLGKTVIASTGVSDEKEIKKAVAALTSNGCPEVVLLHCVSDYPAKPEDFQLSRLVDLQKDFRCPTGVSDHSPGHLIPILATALGARVIEKHLTLDRDDDSIDGKFSLLPNEFKKMSSLVVESHASMGFGRGNHGQRKASTRGHHFKRSILACKPIAKGEIFSPQNLRIARPSGGLCPSKWDLVIGKKAKRDLRVGDDLLEEDLCD